MNVGFEYLYRDAGNNKIRGFVVFSNRANRGIEFLERKIKSYLIDGEFFPACSDLLPALRFHRYDDSLDHGWLEYSGMEVSAEGVNDCQNRDVEDFLDQLIELLEGYPGT